MSKRSNKYMDLVEARNRASDELHNWKKQCVEVNLTLSGQWYGKLYPYDFHNWFDKHFPELVAWRRISDGCQEKLELIAPKDDIVAALQLCLETYERLKTTPLITKCLEKIILNLEVSNKSSIKDWIEEVEEELSLAA